MSRNRTRYPLAAFPPQYKELLLKGGLQTIEVPCESPKAAGHLARELSTFRSRCRNENIAEWEVLYRAVCSTNRRSHILTIRPRGSQHVDAISRALERAPQLEPTSTPQLDSDALAALDIEIEEPSDDLP